MRVFITRDYAELSAKAARFVLAHMWREPSTVLALPTGSTPVGMYQKLVEAYVARQADFGQVMTFNLDEYVGVKPENPGSYHYFMQEHLFRHVNIKRHSTHVPNGNSDTLERTCQEYEDAIKHAGGIKLAVLGIGQNGHIGFNEPGTQFTSRTHVAELSEHTRRANAKHWASGPVPSQAITMGLGTIMESQCVLVLASGKNKAQAVAAAIEGKVASDLPASILQWHPNVTFIIDEAAASKLERDYRSPLLFSEGDVELLMPGDLPKGQRVVVISPHPDDASISMGGLLSAITHANKVQVVIMTTGYRSAVNGRKREEVIKIREQEAKRESEILGSKPLFLRARFYDTKSSDAAKRQDIADLVLHFNRIKPTWIFMPHENDHHPTHHTSRQIALAALEQYERKKKNHTSVWEFESPWALFMERDFNTIFSYGEDVMKRRMRAIASQQSQVSRTRFDVAAKSLAQLRASVVPEQALVGYGARPPRLGKYFELFHVVNR